MQSKAPSLVLASGSEIRATILKNAGISFSIHKTGVDEDEIKEQGLRQHLSIPEIALELARAKASAAKVGANEFVIGSDQILEFEGKPYDKPSSLEAAKNRLQSFAGKTHSLVNATTLFHQGKEIWHHIECPVLYMRPLSENELESYINACDEHVLKSVGAYQVEGLGSRLFSRIDGDYFAVLGLALHPLLTALRDNSLIEF